MTSWNKEMILIIFVIFDNTDPAVNMTPKSAVGDFCYLEWVSCGFRPYPFDFLDKLIYILLFLSFIIIDEDVIWVSLIWFWLLT